MRAARDLDDALRTLASAPGEWRPFAGGTDLMVLLEAGKLPPHKYLSLWNVRELRGVTSDAGTLSLGALTTYTDVLANPIVRNEFPMLAEAARQTGGVATQNRGTIGGNIANASPAADTPPALLVYDAELEIVSTRGTRMVPYASFHRAYKVMDLAADEIIKSVRVPRGRSGWRESYRKVGTRRAQAISKICFAAAIKMKGDDVDDVRVAFGSVAPAVIRCGRVETALRGQPLSDDRRRAAGEALRHDIAPIDDIRSSSAYRLKVAQNLLEEFLQ
jgi:CO/xanthine dehydrogenase FAD-binding subunit